MSYRLTPKEMTSVLRLDQEARLEHFVKRISDWEDVWGLRNDSGWVISQASDGKKVMPLWPHSDYAAQCAIDEWSDAAPALMDLNAFVQKWLPGLLGDGILIEVFPTPHQNGGIIKPDSLRHLVISECSNAYGDKL